jgi:hypothetical protein
MKLEEAFEKYPNTTKLRRKSKPSFSADIKWLKGLKAWGNEDARKLGFIIPKFMIEDANADDWEIMEC